MTENLNQNEIDQLLAGLDPTEEASSQDTSLLTSEERDTFPELCNIAMSGSANALSKILNKNVSISTAGVTEYTSINDILSIQEDSTVGQIFYMSGINSTVMIILKNKDVASIVDIIMGGTGQVDDFEIDETQFNNISNVMTQMLTNANISLSEMLGQSIDTSPPEIKALTSANLPEIPSDLQADAIIATTLNINVEDTIDSEFIQLTSVANVKKQVQLFMGSVNSLIEDVPQQNSPSYQGQKMEDSRMFGSDQEPGASRGFNTGMPDQPVTVQPAQFTSFDTTSSIFGAENQNLDLVLDVTLKLTVELGRSELPIKKVLELTRGSVIELDKVAGEPVELYANGKLIAKGEVVVIEDNFGLRITSIISPADRLKNL